MQVMKRRLRQRAGVQFECCRDNKSGSLSTWGGERRRRAAIDERCARLLFFFLSLCLNTKLIVLTVGERKKKEQKKLSLPLAARCLPNPKQVRLPTSPPPPARFKALLFYLYVERERAKKREKRRLSSRASRVDTAIHPTVSSSSSSICVAAVRDAMSKRDNRVQPNPRSLSAIFSSDQRHRHGNTWPNLKWISGPSSPGCKQKKEEEEKTALAAFD